MNTQTTRKPRTHRVLARLVCLCLALALSPVAARAQSTAPVSRFAQINGARLHYLRAGSGSPVLLIHGFPRTSQSWAQVMPTLALKHTVIAPDVPGLGQSAAPLGGYDPRNLADDLDALMKSLRLFQYAVVAHDLGGPTGYALAATHSESVTRLCLVETGVPNFGLEKVYDAASSPATWYFGFFGSPKYPEMLLTGREKEFMTAWMLRDEGPDATQIPARVRPFFDAYTRPGALLRGVNWYRGLKAGRVQNAALEKAGKAQLRMPTFAIGASRAFKGFTLDGLQRVAPQTRGTIVPGPHFIQEENPRGFLNALQPFLDAGP